LVSSTPQWIRGGIMPISQLGRWTGRPETFDIPPDQETWPTSRNGQRIPKGRLRAPC
jgi:hypothetical protein